jgi:transcriptional regulator with XRE-family HTH domain
MNRPVPQVHKAKDKTSTDEDIGARVRAWRKERGWTQQRLADALGVTHHQLQKYERGSDRLIASRVLRISQLLNVPIAAFFEEAVPPPSQAGDASGSLAPDEKQLLATYRAAAPAKRRWLLRRLRRLEAHSGLE